MTHTPFVSNPCPATAIVFVSQNLFYGQLPHGTSFFSQMTLKKSEAKIGSLLKKLRRMSRVTPQVLLPNPPFLNPKAPQSFPFPHQKIPSSPSLFRLHTLGHLTRKRCCYGKNRNSGNRLPMPGVPAAGHGLRSYAAVGRALYSFGGAGSGDPVPAAGFALSRRGGDQTWKLTTKHACSGRSSFAPFS